MNAFGEPPAIIWTHLAKEGGRWTTGELSKSLDGLNGVRLGCTLRTMARCNLIVRYETNAGLQWGVTKSCRLPKFLTVGDLLQAGILIEKNNDSTKATQ